MVKEKIREKWYPFQSLIGRLETFFQFTRQQAGVSFQSLIGRLETAIATQGPVLAGVCFNPS